MQFRPKRINHNLFERWRIHLHIRTIVLSLFLTALPAAASITVKTSRNATPRERFGVEHLKAVIATLPPGNGDTVILAGTRPSALFATLRDVMPGAKLYIDSDATIEALAPELNGLTGIRISQQQARKDGVRLVFDIPEPAQILVGFFNSSKKHAAAAPPKDEWSPVLFNAVVAANLPPLYGLVACFA